MSWWQGLQTPTAQYRPWRSVPLIEMPHAQVGSCGHGGGGPGLLSPQLNWHPATSVSVANSASLITGATVDGLQQIGGLGEVGNGDTQVRMVGPAGTAGLPVRFTRTQYTGQNGLMQLQVQPLRVHVHEASLKPLLGAHVPGSLGYPTHV